MTTKMRRSEINHIIREAEDFLGRFQTVLPPFGRWHPDEFQARKPEIGAIVEAGLGWDISDFGLGDFARTGLLLFTTRNGQLDALKRGGGMVYAEKVMIARKDQVTPNHAHVIKTEDIINRGGGTLVIELHGASGDTCDRTKGTRVMCDGLARTLPPGGRLLLGGRRRCIRRRGLDRE